MAVFLMLYVCYKLSLEFSLRHSSLPLLEGTVAIKICIGFRWRQKAERFFILTWIC